MITEVNSKLNNQYPKLLQAVSSDLPDETKKAVVYKFVETLEDLVKALDETKH